MSRYVDLGIYAESGKPQHCKKCGNTGHNARTHGR